MPDGVVAPVVPHPRKRAAEGSQTGCGNRWCSGSSEPPNLGRPSRRNTHHIGDGFILLQVPVHQRREREIPMRGAADEVAHGGTAGERLTASRRRRLPLAKGGGVIELHFHELAVPEATND